MPEAGSTAPRPGGQGARHLGRGVDLEVTILELLSERGFEPRQQLDPLQAAEAEVALEGGAEGCGLARALAPGLRGQAAHDLEDPGLEVRGVRGGRVIRGRHTRAL